RKAIVKLAYQGDAVPGASFMPYHMEFYDNSIQSYPYDPAKAKKLLAQVGYNLSIQSYELLTAYDKEDGGHSELGERYWPNDIIDPDEVATFGADCKGGANAFNSYWCSTQATKLVGEARAELDNTARQNLYNQIQQIIYTQSPFIVT